MHPIIPSKTLHPPTLILRHRKENTKKCTLEPLKNRIDFHFLSYPLRASLPALNEYVLLGFSSNLLSRKDQNKGILLLDSSWKYLEKIYKVLPPMPIKGLPTSVTTAYPRRQNDCPSPSQGLASIEALYTAYKILGRHTQGLLDCYFWKDDFLKRNQHIF